MQRKIYKTLLDWKNSDNVKPLMVLGVRQCGKTYVINEFGKNEFTNYKYINLLEDKDIVDLYNSNLNSDEKFARLKLLINFDVEAEDSLLFIDEIQESENIIAELKYFCEKHNSVRIICAGSLLGVALKRGHSSFPVGKVKMIKMYPMDFEEYLNAFESTMLIDLIKEHYNNNKPIGDALHNKIMQYYRTYLVTGGMPEAVQNMLDAKLDYIKFDTNILKDIRTSYMKDMKKYIDYPNDYLKTEQIYETIPSQLSNASKKFQYSKVNKNARSREYDVCLNWLIESYLVEPCYLVTTPEIPLEGFKNIDVYKLYLSDVGVLTSMLNVNIADIITDNISLYKGVIAENYVANQLYANDCNLYYWMSDGTSEVDFLIYNEDGIIPIEVKSSDNTQSKSLKVYMQQYTPKYAIRISTKDFGFNNKIKSVPIYATFCIKNTRN